MKAVTAKCKICIGNHTVFLVKFGINLNLWVFQKAEIALAVNKKMQGRSIGRSFLRPLFPIGENVFQSSSTKVSLSF